MDKTFERMIYMSEERLKKQLEFLVEIDKMKNVLRRTLIVDGSRRENDAEHSWHLAMLAMVLEEYSEREINISRVVRMCLVHDLVEVYAGDTFAYDAKGYEDKLARETAAADKLFSMLPTEQGEEFRALWEEFDEAQTADAMYAAAMDRLQPIMNNFLTDGHTWKEGKVTSDKVLDRMQPIKKATPELWQVVEYIVNTSVERGILQKGSD